MDVRGVKDVNVAPDKFTRRLCLYRKWAGGWYSEVVLVPAVWPGYGAEDQCS
jgi:hypothetical protein